VRKFTIFLLVTHGKMIKKKGKRKRKEKKMVPCIKMGAT
jgi:hypothetical protein